MILEVLHLLVSLFRENLLGDCNEEVIDIIVSPRALFSTDHLVREVAVEALMYLPPSWAEKGLKMCEFVVNDIKVKLRRRVCLRDDRKDSGTEAVLGYPDAEGWGSLETSLKGLRGLCSHYSAVPVQLREAIYDIILEGVKHTNRFAREQAVLLLSELIGLPQCSSYRLDEVLGWIVLGLDDNWSQVRYASLIATRSMVRILIREGQAARLYDGVVPELLLNRHFVAEGVSRHARETWRILVGPQGGYCVIIPALSKILEVISKAVDSPNHSVREAGVSLTLELLSKVLKRHPPDITDEVVESILRTCVLSLEDDTWPVRDVAAQCVQLLYDTIFLAGTSSQKSLLYDRLEASIAVLNRNVHDPMQMLRESSGKAAGILTGIYFSQVSASEKAWDDLLQNLVVSVKICEKQAVDGHSVETFRRLGPDACHENQPMYSCGSLVSNESIRNIHRHSLSDDCCSSGGHYQVSSTQYWEKTHGSLCFLKYFLTSVFLPSHRKVEAITVVIPHLLNALEQVHFRKHVVIQRAVLDLLVILAGVYPEIIRPSLGRFEAISRIALSGENLLTSFRFKQLVEASIHIDS